MRVIFYKRFYVFFFKQKTAYEMRISDWSSDVCSSDLVGIDRDALEECVDGLTQPRKCGEIMAEIRLVLSLSCGRATEFGQRRHQQAFFLDGDRKSVV